MNGSNFKNVTLFLFFKAIVTTAEMGEMAQTFISEIEWLAVLKCRATGLSTSFSLTERRCSANLSDRRRPVSPMQSLQHLLQEMQ